MSLGRKEEIKDRRSPPYFFFLLMSEILGFSLDSNLKLL